MVLYARHSSIWSTGSSDCTFGLVDGLCTPASSVECDLAKGIVERAFLPCAFPDFVDLLEEPGFICSGLLGFLSFDLSDACRHCITDLDGRVSVVLIPGLAEHGREVVTMILPFSVVYAA